MKTLSTLITFLVASSWIQATANAQPERRLIQYDFHQADWMTAEETVALSERNHAKGICGGFMDITPAPGETPRLENLPLERIELFETLSPVHQDAVVPLLGRVSDLELKSTVETLSTKFTTRYYTSEEGKAAAEWIAARFRELSGGRKDVTVRFFEHPWTQPSVIARIEGSGPRADEILVIGAHEDSIAGFFGSSKEAPGADDDATGVATVLEVFRILMESGYQPDRTIEFMTYAAEEVGLRGSAKIAESYKKDGKKVAGVLHFDMTMFDSPTKQMTIFQDNVDPALTKFTEMLVDEYLKVTWGRDVCGYGCSDHASWTRNGFAAALPFENTFDGMNHAIHSKDDVAARLDPSFGTLFAKLGIAFLVELSAKSRL
jgi:leucyl aminopeptidase